MILLNGPDVTVSIRRDAGDWSFHSCEIREVNLTTSILHKPKDALLTQADLWKKIADYFNPL